MRIGIVGLGAVGGFFAARLARSGAQVCALARGAVLQTVSNGGLTLIDSNGQSFTTPLAVGDDPQALGVQDLLVLTVKTTGLSDVARRLGPMIGPKTVIFSAMNGIPWWFFEGLDPKPPIAPLKSIDPDLSLAQQLPPAQVIGCVTHLACSSPEPGVVKQMMGERLIIGEPNAGEPNSGKPNSGEHSSGRPATSPRCAAVQEVFSRAGFQVEVSQRIQQDIWFKLWGNMTVNPVSAITGATGDRILDDRAVRDFMTRCMLEGAAIGERIGLPIAMTPQERHDVTRKLGAFRTSMLQDMAGGRPLELDALVASVLEIGAQVGVAAPNLDALMGLARLTARTRGLY